MIILAALVIVLIATTIGALLNLAGLGFLAGVLLAAWTLWATSPSPRR